MLKTVGNPASRTGDQTIVNGNLVISTAGKGIDFSADPSAPGMTSELLDDYEEGTWTPSVSSLSGTITTVGSVTGTYTKVGNLVTLQAFIPIADNGTGAGALVVTSLPFAPSATASIYSGQGLNNTNAKALTVYCQSSILYVRLYDATYPLTSGEVAVITICYPT